MDSQVIARASGRSSGRRSAPSSEKPWIAVTIWLFGTVGGNPVKRLEEAGFRVRRNTRFRTLTNTETSAMARDAVGIIAGVEHWSDEMLAACPRLKVISRIGVGLDNIDLDAARRRGIAVTTTPRGSTQAVAEVTLGMILSLSRRLPVYSEAMSRGTWKAVPNGMLTGKTLGIVGLGRIGRRLVDLAKPFGLRVLASEPEPDLSFVHQRGVTLVSLESLLRASDIVSLHLSYSPSVRHLMNQKRFGLMKRGALFINTSRGAVVDETALLAAVRSKRVAGAGLDVFETEPYRGMLCRMPNVITTPHVASFTQESWRDMEEQAIDNLLAALCPARSRMAAAGKGAP